MNVASLTDTLASEVVPPGIILSGVTFGGVFWINVQE